MDTFKSILKGFHDHFGWFIWSLLAIGILWFIGGGAADPAAHFSYLKPLPPLGTGATYGHYFAGQPYDPNEVLNLPEGPAIDLRAAAQAVADLLAASKTASAFHTRVLALDGMYIDGTGGAQATDPEAEYVRIVVNPKAQGWYNLSGLSLDGVGFANPLVIPQGTLTFVTGAAPVQQLVALAPGDRAIITTGVSPVGTSFRVNSCSGYLNQVATFTPALQMNCPDGSGCRAVPGAGFSYNICVAAHQKDANFYTNEWRIFLGQPTEIWKNSADIIELKDVKGGVIDALAY